MLDGGTVRRVAAYYRCVQRYLDRQGADVKKAWWKRSVLVGAVCSALTASVAQAGETPVEATAPVAEKQVQRVYGPPPSSVVPGTYAMVGEYRVGHVHEPGLAHLFWYSAYNPYLDELHKPYREAVYGGRHARYYTGYRHLYTPGWDTYYVPQAQCYAPGAYGYSATSGTQAHTTYYGPGQSGQPAAAGYAAPPADVNINGFRYTGDPSVYSPYGVGSSSYFGVYGSAGY